MPARADKAARAAAHGLFISASPPSARSVAPMRPWISLVQTAQGTLRSDERIVLYKSLNLNQ
jgi:hypothetical protein